MGALQMTWHPNQRRRSGPPLGLKNLGNSCYLNSVLQCLTYTPPLAQFCLSFQHSSLCKSIWANRDRECPFCILERQIARSLSLDGPLLADAGGPHKIQKCLPLFAQNFRLGRQEDAHEFLRYVIDACHNTCLRLLKRLSATSNGNGGARPPPPNGLVMKEIFGGALLSQVKCLSCKGESNKTDEIMDISLDLFQSNSVKDAFGRFFQPEVLDGDNKYGCEKCKKLSVAKKQMFIHRAPNVLVIQLKRFEGIHGVKITRNIEFEEVLVLSKFMYNATQDFQLEYNLFGSIVHSGYSPESGHYYAYIKDASGRWYRCNDAHVSLSSTKEVLSEKVYILFYLRSNQCSRSSKNGVSCNGKSSDCNGSEILPCQKPSDLLKPPIKPNGVLSSKNISPTAVKNGKISSNLQFKSFNLKKPEAKRVTQNGNGNHVIQNNASVEKNGDFGQSTVKGNKPLPENSSMEESKIEEKVELPSSHNDSAANGSSDSREHSEKHTLLVLNGNGCSNSQNAVHDGSNHKEVAGLEIKVDCNNSSDNMIDNNNSGISGFKRKLAGAERAEVPVLCSKDSSSLPSSGILCKTQSSCHVKHLPEELEEFKNVIAAEASSYLRSCGWVDRVHDFMRSRKRLCTQAEDTYPDNTELRKQFIIDAKKTFTSQVPETLKEHLIARLKLFSQGKSLLDS